MISELFLPDLLLIKDNGELSDQNDFFASLYFKQENWREPLPHKPGINGRYTPDRNSGEVKLYNISVDSWLEFQKFISDSYALADFIGEWVVNLDAATLSYYLTRAGLITNSTRTTTLTASNGQVLATGLTTPALWESAWNSLRVPYERTTVKNVVFPYIKYVQTTSSVDYYRQSTFNFDGTV